MDSIKKKFADVALPMSKEVKDLVKNYGDVELGQQFIGGVRIAPVVVAPGVTTPVSAGYLLRVCDGATSAACAATGTSTAPVSPAAVVEFYNASLDHYFVSSLQPDIDALDSGRISGWARTGQSFKVYPTQAAGGASGPQARADSFFCSAATTRGHG